MFQLKPFPFDLRHHVQSRSTGVMELGRVHLKKRADEVVVCFQRPVEMAWTALDFNGLQWYIEWTSNGIHGL